MAQRHGHTVRGIVVDHKENGVRYAVSPRNYNPDIHILVRELRPGETVLGYKPKRRQVQAPPVAPARARGRASIAHTDADPGSTEADTKDPSTEGTEDTTNQERS